MHPASLKLQVRAGEDAQPDAGFLLQIGKADTATVNGKQRHLSGLPVREAQPRPQPKEHFFAQIHTIKTQNLAQGRGRTVVTSELDETLNWLDRVLPSCLGQVTGTPQVPVT